MMPTGHIVFALGTTQLGRRALPRRNNVDWRLIALVPLLPDLIDKPLAVVISPLLFSHAHSSRLIAHSLLPSLLLLAVTLLFRRGWLPYTLALSSHLIADRMWNKPVTLLWPAYGLTAFRSVESSGVLRAIAHVHGDNLMQYLQTWLVELSALTVLAWLVWHYQLWRWQNLRQVLVSGHVPNPTATRILRSLYNDS
jgi:hypothetical protein